MRRRTALIAAVPILLCCIVQASGGVRQQTGSPVVRIESGALEGTFDPENPGVAYFRGIPYAAPPVGKLRWKPPRPVEPWSGTRRAVELAPAAPQPDFLVGAQQRNAALLGGDPSSIRPLGQTNEDCLYLNVLTANLHGAARLPVMVFIHGGGGTSGRGGDDGATLVRDGVVVVTIAYRLGVLGWLSHPELTAESPEKSSGNYGLLDQIAALRWVKRNIAQFGGDPANVTIFGQSSGGEYVGCLMVSPLARGLFERAIMQSGVPLGAAPDVRTPSAGDQSAEQAGVNLARALGAGEGAGAIEKLRSMSADDLIRRGNPLLPYDVVVDGWVVPEQPLAAFAHGRVARVPLIVGATDREYSNLIALHSDTSAEAFRGWVKRSYPPIADDVLAMYAPSDSDDGKESFIRAVTDLVFVAPSRWAAHAMRRGEPRVFLYDVSWAYSSAVGRERGAFHGIDLLLLFDYARIPRDATGDAVAVAMRRYWTRFAKTGNPNAAGLPNWPAYDTRTGAYLELGARIEARTGLRAKAFALVDRVYTGRLRRSKP